MHLVINQPTDRTEQVTGACIDKLYNLSKNNTLDSTSYLRGSINAASAYEDAVTFLNTMWGPDLIVTASAYYIRFADPEVESVLKTALNKAEDEGITTQEAADNSIGDLLNNNQDITSFNEFKYFRKNNTNTTYKINNCPALVSIDLSECTNYPGGTFQNLPNLEYFNGPNSESGVLTFPEGTTTIGYYQSFYKLPKLKHIIFPSTMRSFNANEFNDCPNIETITLNPGFETFGGNSLNQDGNGKLIISDLNAYFNIAWAPINGCKNFFKTCPYFYLKDSNGDLTEITTITIPQTMLTIPGAIFWKCKSLIEVVFHSDIISIGCEAFSDCVNLVNANVALPNLGTLERGCFHNTRIISFTDLGGVSIIPSFCFSDNPSLTTVYLPSSVTTIQESAFESCSNLAKFSASGTIGDLSLPNLTTLGKSAFQETKVQTISDLGSVTSIPEYCFKGCSQLTTIDQGVLDNITVLDREAFNLCTNLGSAKQSDNTISSVLRLPNLTSIALDSVRYTKFTEIADLGSITTVMGFSEMYSLTSVVLPQTCTAIGNNAFTNDTALTTIDISNITSIGDGAFKGCTNLIIQDLNLPNLTSLGTTSFQNTKIQSISDLGNVTEIPDSCFFNITTLTTVVVPNSVTKIGSSAFSGCSGLTSITINAVTPPTLAPDVFKNTNNCPIYVPAGSVSAYQSASGWSTYASRIQAIPNS